MKKELHSHWTVKGGKNPPQDDASQNQSDEDIQNVPVRVTETKTKGKSVPVSSDEKSSTLYSNAMLGSVGVAAVVFVFVQGVTFIQADLTDAYERGELTAEVDEVPFADAPARSADGNQDQKAKTTEDALTPPKSDPQTDTPTVMPPVPTLEKAPEPSVVPAPKVVTPKVTPPKPAPVVAPIAPKPVQPAVAPVLDLSTVLAPVQQVSSSWPLRVNRYTLGSGLVPTLSPIQHITIRIDQKQDPVHGVAGTRPQVRRQPQTGPGVWVAVCITLGMLPLVLRRKRI